MLPPPTKMPSPAFAPHPKELVRHREAINNQKKRKSHMRDPTIPDNFSVPSPQNQAPIRGQSHPHSHPWNGKNAQRPQGFLPLLCRPSEAQSAAPSCPGLRLMLRLCPPFVSFFLFCLYGFFCKNSENKRLEGKVQVPSASGQMLCTPLVCPGKPNLPLELQGKSGGCAPTRGYVSNSLVRLASS